MTNLDRLYVDLLHVGLIVLRQAADSGSLEWVSVELELLHNVPSLIAEENKERHRYFWEKERTHYINWVSSPGRDIQRSRMRTYYEPIWENMNEIFKHMFTSKSV